MADTFERVREILARYARPGAIEAWMTLYGDLGLDSQDVIRAAMDIEEDFYIHDVEIDRRIGDPTTVAGLAAIVDNLVAAARPGAPP